MVVLDTCALIEALLEKPSFSQDTLALMEQRAYILSVSFAEIACKIKLGKLRISISVNELHERYQKITAVEIMDISTDDWLRSIDLAWPENKDPADRLITSFAMHKKCNIVTSDQKVAAFYQKTVW